MSKLHLRNTTVCSLECDFSVLWILTGHTHLCTRSRPDHDNCLHMYVSMHPQNLSQNACWPHSCIPTGEHVTRTQTQGQGTGIKGHSVYKTSLIPLCLGTRLGSSSHTDHNASCHINTPITHHIQTNTDKHERITRWWIQLSLLV